ncbi:MAG: hypothetical protein QM776_12875 [Rhodocyclaceae bacterium]
MHARDGNVLELTAAESVAYDDNLYRLAPDSNATQLIGSERRDDLGSTTTLQLAADKLIGRQNLFGSYRHAITRYQIHKTANYDLDDGQAGWRGGFGAYNQWDVFYKRSSVQSDYSDRLSYVSNVVDTSALHAGTEIRYRTDWRTDLSLEDERQRNSTTARNGGDYNGRLFQAGFGYWPLTGNKLGVQFRQARREYSGDRGWRENAFNLLGAYSGSAVSKLDGSAGVQLQRGNDGATSRNLRFSLNHLWVPAGQSSYSLRLIRERSAASNSGSAQADINGVQAHWYWAMSAKLRLDSGFDYQRRKYDGYIEPGTSQPIERKEYVRVSSLTLSYIPVVNMTASLAIQNHKRDANHIRYNYDAQSCWLSLQYVY